MTPQNIITSAVKNMPTNRIEGFKSDMEKALNYAESIITYKTASDEEKCNSQRMLERLSNIMFFYFQQGGMKKTDWEKVDRTYSSIGEKHWNQFKCLIELKDEILQIIKEKEA